MTTLPITIDDGENEPETINVPAYWAICDKCQGEGKSSAHLGAFTREQFDEDPDFAEDYMNGFYDKLCEHCKGSGKVLLPDIARCMPQQFRRAIRHLRAKERYDRESYNERKWESLMLGETRLEDWY